jgi:putative endonuclease
MSNTTEQGSYYEEMACLFLQKKGLTLLAKNFRHRQGEIDLIMRQDHTLVFVEVRYRKKDFFGSAEESITYRKQQSIISTAKYFLMKNKLWDSACRFDAITIKPSKQPFKTHDINWVVSAFE